MSTSKGLDPLRAFPSLYPRGSTWWSRCHPASQWKLLASAVLVGLVVWAEAGCNLFLPDDGRITVRLVNAASVNGQTMTCAVYGDIDQSHALCYGSAVISKGTASTQLVTVFKAAEPYYVIARANYRKSKPVRIEIDGDKTLTFDYARFEQYYFGP